MRNASTVDNFNLKNKLAINQQIEVEVLAGKYEGEYQSTIADILDEDIFIINTPFSNGKVIQLAANTKINIIVRSNNGIYKIPVRVLRRKVDSTPLLVVKLSGEIIRIQERKFFRLQIYQETKYKIIGKLDDEISPSEMKFNTKNLELHQGMIEDISAGGLKLNTADEISENQIIEIKFDFANVKFDTIIGQVIRVKEVMRNEERKYIAGVNYLDCDRNLRDELMGWLFKKQRELRKKGLI